MVSFKTSYVSTILLSALLVHCGHDKAPEPASPMPPPAASPAPVTVTPPPPQQQQMTPASGSEPATQQGAPAPAPEPLTDDAIFKILDLANGAEVDQAKIAQTKAKSAKVKNFAAMMIQHHGKAKAKGSKLSTKLGVTPADTPASMQLKSDAEAMTTTLKTTPGTDFDRVYMDGQVQEHQKVLSTFDDKLVPSAKDPELKALLQEMRATVASHLADAQKIQAELQAAAGGAR